MGRQINFVHSEIDSISFLNEIEKRSYKLLDGKCFEIVEHPETVVIKQMQGEQFRFYIAPDLDVSQMHGTIPKPRLIELDNCYKRNETSRTYEVGRLFVMPDNNSEYDEKALGAFQSLSAYIRKNYAYSKKSGVYFGQDFLSKYRDKYYFALSGGVNPIFF